MNWLVYQTIIEEQSFDAASGQNNIKIGTHIRRVKADTEAEAIRIPYGLKNVGKGSDIWMEPEGYRDGTKDRWSRECKKCGHIQYTYTQEPIISGHKPKF